MPLLRGKKERKDAVRKKRAITERDPELASFNLWKTLFEVET
jgi:hypothetical protein